MSGHIVIAGGGIGGLSTAMGLAGAGFQVTVLEQADVLGEIGAGIQIGPNAFHSMDYLGVGEAARKIAVYIDDLVLMDAISGENVAKIPVNEPFRKRFGNPYAVIHRADLHGVFLKACQEHPNVELHTSVHVTGYKQSSESVQVTTASGQTFSGDALIGADGVRSKIREQMTGGDAKGDSIRISGHVAYRAVLPIEEMPEQLRWNAATLWAGPKCHLVHYPLQGWKTFNIVATFDGGETEIVSNQPGSRDEILSRFAGANEKPLSILTKPREWRRWVLGDREPIDNWTDGNVVLLGDAAHPTLQYFAQGAAMALEDAVCLTDKLSHFGGNFNEVFKSFQQDRMVRSYRVVLNSREIGKHIYHPEGMHRHIRNSIMSQKTPEDFYQHLQWLYGSNGLKNTGEV